MNSSPRRSIIPLDPVDIGGINPRADELVTEEVIGFLTNTNINSRLLTNDDPLKDEYTKFLNDLGNSPIIITNEDIDIGDSDGYFDDVDLSSTMSMESENLVINKDYFVGNRLWANGVFHSTIMPICPVYASPLTYQDNFKRKVMGEVMEFVPQHFSYQPKELSQMVELVLLKK